MAEERNIENMSDDEIRAAIAQRDRQRDPDRAHAILRYVLEHSREDVAAGLEALLIGSPDTLRPAQKGDSSPFWSAKARQLDLLSVLLGHLIAELEKGGVYALWTGGGPDFERDVARALWTAGQRGAPPAGQGPVPAEAQAVAQIIHSYFEVARNQQNREGGYHHGFPGAMISGSHDALKLLRAGKSQWVLFIRPLLEDRTFEGEDPAEFLGMVWEALRKGIDDDLYLYFKDADSWTAYNRRFGFETLRDAVVGALERTARRAGLFAILGAHPEHWLKGIFQALEEGQKIPIGARARAQLHAILTALAPTWRFTEESAGVDRIVSAMSREGMIHLGEALFSENEDLPAFGKPVPYQKSTLQEAIDADLATFVSGTGITRAEGRPGFAMGVAVFAESFNAALMDRFFAFDNPPGRTAELLRQFLKLNVTYWSSELMRRAAFTSLSAYLGQAMKVGFAEADADFKTTLSHYGVGATDWEASRAMMGIAPAAKSLDQATARAAKEKLDAWLWDRLVATALAPDGPEHARFGRGATELTSEGELLRFITQFRTLRAPFLPKPNATIEPRDADHAMVLAMASGDGLPALSALLVWTVLFARLTRFGFDVVEGDAPAIGKDEWPWLKSALVGGALGFCADILFGDTTGMKVLPISAIADISHPSVGSALRIWRQARDAKDVRGALATWAEREGDASALDTLQMTRQALNYALLHQLQDMISPGYLQRSVKEMDARTAQAYWRAPGARDPFGRR